MDHLVASADEDAVSAPRRRRVVGELAIGIAEAGRMAEMAGVSEVTLFRKYGSKEELVKKALGAVGGLLKLLTVG